MKCLIKKVLFSNHYTSLLVWKWWARNCKDIIPDQALNDRIKIWREYDETLDEYEELVSGLDKESVLEINSLLSNYRILEGMQKIPITRRPIDQKWLGKELSAFYTKSHPESIYFTEDINLNKCGLVFVPNTRERIKGKTILDCGAYIGDSAFMFQELEPTEIYSFEPNQENHKKLCENLKNYVPKAFPFQLGIGEKDGKAFTEGEGVNTHLSSSGKEAIEVKSIDRFVRERQILNIGVIKMDIEGAELGAIKGALNTIREYKPILLISVYHTPQDLFKIKPILEKENLGYKFKIRKLVSYHPVYETSLIGWCND